MTLDQILKFISLTHKLQKVQRTIYVKDESRMENDLEHQYQLAMLAWYIIDTEKLKINKDKVIQYALVHDIVEVYAGDTFFYDTKAHRTKQRRERDALAQIKNEFPEFKELHSLVTAYWLQKDKESKFVYALDKLIPIYNIYLDGGRIWRHMRVSLTNMIERKRPKISVSPEVKIYFQDLIKQLKQEEKQLFLDL